MKRKFSTLKPEAGQTIDLYAPRAKRPLLRGVTYDPSKGLFGAVLVKGQTYLYVKPTETWTKG